MSTNAMYWWASFYTHNEDVFVFMTQKRDKWKQLNKQIENNISICQTDILNISICPEFCNQRFFENNGSLIYVKIKIRCVRTQLQRT